MSAAPRELRCRYLRRSGNRCESPATDQSPDARVHLCVRHLARAMELVKEWQAKVTAGGRG